MATATVLRRAPRWTKPKHVDPRPRAKVPPTGTKQRQMYQMLKRKSGVKLEDFCRRMNDASPELTAPWTPQTAWGHLRHLFATQRGYGLDFDGKRVKLLANEEVQV